MIERITSNTNPDFLFLTYSKTRNMVENFLIIPKHFFTPNIILKRKPLAITARRARWVGCNIDLKPIPKDVPDEVIIQNNKIDLNSNNVLVDFINTRKYFSYERDENGKLNKVLRNGLRIRVECDIT